MRMYVSYEGHPKTSTEQFIDEKAVNVLTALSSIKHSRSSLHALRYHPVNLYSMPLMK